MKIDTHDNIKNSILSNSHNSLWDSIIFIQLKIKLDFYWILANNMQNIVSKILMNEYFFKKRNGHMMYRKRKYNID